MDAPHREAQRSTLRSQRRRPRYPASPALSGPAFQVAADRLEGTGFVQFAQIGQTGCLVTAYC